MAEPQSETRARLWRRGYTLALAAIATAAVLIALLVLVVIVVGHAASDVVSPPPSREARDKIKHANCKQLIELEYRYILNSGEPDMTALRLTRERIAALHCPLPPALRPSPD